MECIHNGIDEWCDTCGECHACHDGKIPDIDKNPEGINVTAKSQKARGLYILSEFCSSALEIERLIQTEADIQKNIPTWISWPQFARPCPVRPRHGFVESRKVDNWEDVRAVLKETLEADPEGEVMLLPYIRADYNSIWTPTLLTVGKGHDGATSGRDTIMIPLVPPKRDLTKWWRAAGLTENDAPYIEAVHEGGATYLTQLRAGTPLPPNCSLDFLPRTVEVKEVIKTNGEDLLAWETITIDLAKRDDVIVWHPGGSLTDHYSVHCRERGIPVAITYEPLVGETILAKGTTGDSVEEDIPGVLRYVDVVMAERPDPDAVLRGVYVGQEVALDLRRARAAVNLIMIGLHFSPVMTGEHGKWIGIAAALMCRLGSIACHGEARHWAGSSYRTFSRDAVYDKGWNKSLQFHKSSLSRLANIFRYGRFGSSSFGGENWARCAYALAPLFTAISKLAADRSDAAVSDIILALNIAVNQAHNGGWWLNKFNGHNVMDTIQKGELEDILRAAPIVYEIGDADRRLSAIPDRTLSRWRRWGEVTIKPMPIKEVSMFMVPGIPAVQLVMVPGKPFTAINEKRFVIPFEHMTERPLKDDKLFLVPGATGWQVQAKRGIEHVTLWKEPPFTVQARTIIGGSAV